MKTVNSQYFFNQPLLKLCRKLGIGVLRYLSSDQLLHFLSWDMSLVKSLKLQFMNWLALLAKSARLMAYSIAKLNLKTKLQEKFSSFSAHVSLGAFASLRALKSSSGVNRRMFVGLVLMGICAPVFYCTYFFFDREAEEIKNFTFYNYFHLFFLIRFHIAGIFFLIGTYHWFEQTRRSKIIAPFLGFLVMNLIMNVNAENVDAIWSLGSWYGMAACTAFAISFLLGLDFFIWRKFHRGDAYDARIQGLVQVEADIPAEKWKSMMLTVLREQKEFKRRG